MIAEASDPDFWLADNWPRGRAPARADVHYTNDGIPYPYAELWVSIGAGDDLWTSYSIPLVCRERPGVLDTWRRAVDLAGDLERQRDAVVAAAAIAGYGEPV